jgi:uncharacterized membrane protein YadS
MIQRIQSIFYLCAGLTFGALFKFPFATSEIAIPQYLSDQSYDVMDHSVLTVMAALGLVVSLVAIFLFRNRPLQIKLGYLVIIFSILLPLVAFLLIYNEQTAAIDASKINDGLGLYLPVLALLFGILANRFVKKDEGIVKSMDRLR